MWTKNLMFESFFLLFAGPPLISKSTNPLSMRRAFHWQVDWAEEQASRTDEFQKELQAKTEAMSDLHAEKVW